MIKVIVLIGLIYCVFGASIHFQDCGSLGSYTVDEVILDVPCQSQPCWVPVKTKTDATVSFKSSNLTALDMTTDVNVLVANNRKRIEVTPVTCPKSVCPIRADERKVYSIQINPNFHVEPIRVEIYWEATNQLQDELFCVTFPVIVYNPETYKPGGNYKHI
ncbi:hypothetical protein RUM44_007487 [Polyplax serrata]|uniref:MD-2-related lipid-recognition domain-containing protein n=1 Tax=Polyplax serrata TaxID=468196 RepID=A0ABR1B0V7_POLSC